MDVARCSLLLEGMFSHSLVTYVMTILIGFLVGQDELVLTLVGKEMRITLNLQTVDPQVDR